MEVGGGGGGIKLKHKQRRMSGEAGCSGWSGWRQVLAGWRGWRTVGQRWRSPARGGLGRRARPRAPPFEASPPPPSSRSFSSSCFAGAGAGELQGCAHRQVSDPFSPQSSTAQHSAAACSRQGSTSPCKRARPLPARSVAPPAFPCSVPHPEAHYHTAAPPSTPPVQLHGQGYQRRPGEARQHRCVKRNV